MKFNKEHENDIEEYLIKTAKKKGFLCYKFKNSGQNGIPDRILIGYGKTFFIELKAPGEKPRKLQIKKINEMRNHGATVYVVDSKEQIDQILDDISNQKASKKGETNDIKQAKETGNSDNGGDDGHSNRRNKRTCRRTDGVCRM